MLILLLLVPLFGCFTNNYCSLESSFQLLQENRNDHNSFDDEEAKKLAALQANTDRLMQELGTDFVNEVFYPWFTQNRLWLTNKAHFEGFPFHHALMQCVLDTCPDTPSNKRTKKSAPLVEVTSTGINEKRLLAYRVLSTLLVSGLEGLTTWKLLPQHSWAQLAFTFINNPRIKNAIKTDKAGVAKGIFYAFTHPEYDLIDRIDLFFYLMNPEAATRTYCLELRKGIRRFTEPYNQTPLMWAATFGHATEILAILRAFDDVATDYDFESDPLIHTINDKNMDGLAAIDYACLNNKIQCVELLMLSGSAAPQVETVITLAKRGYADLLRVINEHMVLPPEVNDIPDETKRAVVVELLKRMQKDKAALKQKAPIKKRA